MAVRAGLASPPWQAGTSDLQRRVVLWVGARTVLRRTVLPSFPGWSTGDADTRYGNGFRPLRLWSPAVETAGCSLGLALLGCKTVAELIKFSWGLAFYTQRHRFSHSFTRRTLSTPTFQTRITSTTLSPSLAAPGLQTTSRTGDGGAHGP